MSKDFGKLLRQYRNDSGLTQPQLLQMLKLHGVDYWGKAIISKWETGRITPKDSVMEVLEDILHTRRGVLFDAAGKHEMADYRRISEDEEVEVNESQLPRESVMDPVLIKARQEHMDKIGTTVQKWKEVFPWEIPLFDEQFDKKQWNFILNNLPGEINLICNDSFFKKVVREHLRFEELWEAYSNWEKMWSELVDTCERVRLTIAELKKQAETWIDVIEIGEGFERNFSTIITYRQLGDAGVAIVRFSISNDWLYAYLKFPDGETSQTEAILRAKYPKNYIENYESLIDKLLKTEDTIKIITLSPKLFEIQWSIHDTLENILISHAWVTSDCQLCPR
ncbi:multiprotein-bridging factor 1 family protein [Chloroflexota bacterium]